MAGVNPISGVAPSGQLVYSSVKCPSSFVYRLQDVSAPEAGRTEDTLMQKMRIAQKVKIDLEWSGVTTAELSAILRAFNPEYISVKFLDPYANAVSTKTFYVGDRSAPMYNATEGLWENVAFNIIER